MSSIFQNQFSALEKFCDGTLGISAAHLENNKTIQFNADQRFLMCSTYKVAIATYLLHLAERNAINLNTLCEVSESSFLPGMISSLNQLNYEVPQLISLKSLMSLMLRESCNTSTSIVLSHIGGPQALNEYLQQNHIHGIGMDFYTMENFATWEGITNLPKNCTLEEFAKLELAVPPEQVKIAREKLKADIEKSDEGTATPNAMTQLLSKLFRHELLNPASTDCILKIMRSCKTGPLRLMGRLPPQTPVAHKTGSLTGYTCDIGIITLPDKQGHIAISAYIKNSTRDLASSERVLAEVGRMVFDFFLYTSV